MAGRGLQEIPIRIPEKWDASWFSRFVREVLAQADIRNAVEGTGISITGNSSEPATLSASADIAGLLNVPFVTLSVSSQLTAERVINAGSGIALTDNGAGSTLTISVNNVPYSLLDDLPPLSVLGNQLGVAGPPAPIGGSLEHDVLSVWDDGSGGLFLQFGTITHESVSDFDEAAQDAVGTILVSSSSVTLTYADATPSITAGVITQMSVTSDASGVKLVNDETSPGNDQYYGTDSGGTKGFFDLPSGGGAGGSLVYVNTTIPAGNTVANTTTETAFASTYDIPANTLAVGSVIRIKLWGTYSTDAVLAPTIRGRLKLDATTVIDTGTITAIIGATNRGWSGEAQLVVTAIGASGSVDSQGLVEFSTAATAALLVNAPNTAGIAVDTTQALTVSATAEWGTADADNTITLRQMAIWIEAAVTADDLSTAILALTPAGYWKCDEASGNFADSSGAGNTLVASGTIDYQAVTLVPSRPSEKYAFFRQGAGAQIAGAIGTSPPLVGDYSVLAIVLMGGGLEASAFSIGGNGESTATNYQVLLGQNINSRLRAFWEQGAGGANVDTLCGFMPGVTAHLICYVKDGTANTVTFNVDGRYAGTIGYATEPTGGTTVNTGIASITGAASDPIGLAHVAFFNGTKLTTDQLANFARIAGLNT